MVPSELAMTCVMSECVKFNVPLDTKQVISEMSLSSQSLGYGTDKTNLHQPR